MPVSLRSSRIMCSGSPATMTGCSDRQGCWHEDRQSFDPRSSNGMSGLKILGLMAKKKWPISMLPGVACASPSLVIIFAPEKAQERISHRC